jgi:hypothetical protein
MENQGTNGWFEPVVFVLFFGNALPGIIVLLCFEYLDLNILYSKIRIIARRNFYFGIL